MQVLTQGDMQVESVIPVLDIRNFRMEIRANTLIYARIEGIVSDEEREECLLQSMAGTSLTVRAGNIERKITLE